MPRAHSNISWVSMRVQYLWCRTNTARLWKFAMFYTNLYEIFILNKWNNMKVKKWFMPFAEYVMALSVEYSK